MGKERSIVEKILKDNGMLCYNNGPNFSKFQCPLCDGRLVLTQGPKQRKVLMRCISGCKLEDILIVLGIGVQSLFKQTKPNSSNWLNSGESP